MTQKGMAAVEYAILVMAIAAVIVMGVSLFGETVRDLFRTAASIFQQIP
jgi:Flp pilus assembly pilin Flp